MYLRLLEEYSTYMTKANKRKTLVLLYELLMHPDGDVRRIAGRHYGFILANINRNIHLDNMQAYASVMHTGSTIYMSGFYTQDLPTLQTCARQHGLLYKDHLEKNNWVAARFVKE